VLMLHGIGGGHLSFAPQVETLATAGYRAVAWDMPGYGRSAPIEPYTFKGLAQSCVALIESLKVRDVVLLGHSMGGMVAQELVARGGARLDGLILACTSASFGSADGAWQARFVAERLAPLDEGLGMEGMARRLVPGMVADDASDDARAEAIDVMARVPESTYRVALRTIAAFNRRADLPRIAVPTLCLAGDADRTAPPELMQRMAARIPGAEFAVLAGAGHIANLERPEAFDAAVLSFVRRRVAGG
jgi:3-oxoadipate enol-lactonase